jgi:hypothetical protein
MIDRARHHSPPIVVHQTVEMLTNIFHHRISRTIGIISQERIDECNQHDPRLTEYLFSSLSALP